MPCEVAARRAAAFFLAAVPEWESFGGPGVAEAGKVVVAWRVVGWEGLRVVLRSVEIGMAACSICCNRDASMMTLFRGKPAAYLPRGLGVSAAAVGRGIGFDTRRSDGKTISCRECGEIYGR